MSHNPSAIERNMRLAWDLAYRDLAIRSGNSKGVVVWLVITPVSYACIYWLVFGYFLDLKWTNPTTGANVSYIVPLFAGLATYLLFADAIIASLSTFRNKRDYVRRAAIPLWVLWLATLIRVSVGGGINFVVLVLLALLNGLLTWKALVVIPVAISLVMVAAISISLFVSLVGVFFADFEEGFRILLRVLFYMAPITYPMSIVPDRFVGLIGSNPLTLLVQTVRDAFVFGTTPSLLPSLLLSGCSIVVLGMAIWLYSRLKGAIADVV